MANRKLAALVIGIVNCALVMAACAAPGQTARQLVSSPTSDTVAVHRLHAPRGVPKHWCHQHPRKCNRIRRFVDHRVAQFRDRTVDRVHQRTIPHHVRRMAIQAHNRKHGGGCQVCVRVDDGDDWFDRWVQQADCVRHGYGCYPTSNAPTGELSRSEKIVLWCSATVIVTSVPGAQSFMQLGSARSRCFWGAVGYLSWIWGR
jgi:hypothetical protein